VDSSRLRGRLVSPAGLSTNTGPIAAAAWLATQGLLPESARWSVEVTLAAPEAQLVIEVFAEEWGFRFEKGERVSWIRVTDVPFIHGRDEHGLLRETPALKSFGKLVRKLEEQHGIQFDRKAAAVRSTITGAEPVIRAWAESL
jgi:hypothetical protein